MRNGLPLWRPTLALAAFAILLFVIRVNRFSKTIE